MLSRVIRIRAFSRAASISENYVPFKPRNSIGAIEIFRAIFFAFHEPERSADSRRCATPRVRTTDGRTAVVAARNYTSRETVTYVTPDLLCDAVDTRDHRGGVGGCVCRCAYNVV